MLWFICSQNILGTYGMYNLYGSSHDDVRICVRITNEVQDRPFIMVVNILGVSISGFIQASLSKFQGLLKDFSRLSYSFQRLKVMKNPDLSIKILLWKC